MDRVYRNQRFFYDLTRKYYLFGRDRLIRTLNLQPGETLAEIGCGTARNLIVISRTYPGNQLYGLDASAQMLRTAEGSVSKAQLAGRISLAQGYAERLTPGLLGTGKLLNHIIFPYSLSMIPDWKGALSAAQGALGPGGRLHVVDFGDLAGLPRPAGALLKGWLRQFHVAPRESLLQAFEAAPPARARKLEILPCRYAFLLTADRDDPVFRAL